MFSSKEIKNKLEQQLRCHGLRLVFRDLAITIFCKSRIKVLTSQANVKGWTTQRHLENGQMEYS